MNKEQIIKKLTSRKFILTVAVLIFSILCVTGVIPVDMQEDWKGIAVSIAAVIAYVLGEGAADVAGAIHIGHEDEVDNEDM